MTLKASNVAVQIEKTMIIQNLSLHLHEGEFIGLIGPNGSGKSTFLKTLYRSYFPLQGTVTLYNKELPSYSFRAFAKEVAVVTQESSVPFDFSVLEIVLMGRHPHQRFFSKEEKKDYDAAYEALASVDLTDYAERSFSSLSGGEKQRVLIARALAQQTNILLLDEPTNHLDIHHQLQLLNTVKNSGLTVVCAMHDLNLAAAYCDRIIVINKGEMVFEGTPNEVITEQMLKEVFEVDTVVIRHPQTGKKQILFTPEDELQSLVVPMERKRERSGL
ncbi:heme ABC transporter ATP-binding protein [Alkalihalobacillus sp. LMS39]|uniref:heme ABC transporter ATP-binding protein n=1 Tax=Alkalihalobacillus sp. LMS39 TaxID=2924032 RepID=UPI001FB4FFA3|nr:heme ABC transporter ATP-binding protein [Alkalihalobacillus sp. LMS39]UOE96005.1 heme ABC transporter ATP-binding protein [Alkalihalobacillus sp. LMS39]